MKILIMSDTHGLTNEIETIKKRHDSDVVVHCGDSELASDALVLNGVEVVKGNCDSASGFVEEIIVDLDDGITCLVTHGHLYGVKGYLQKLIDRAEELAVNFCFFGHTHIAGTVTVNNTIFINPGSLKTPQNSIEKSYAILEIQDTAYNLTYYNQEGLEIKEKELQIN